MNEDEMKKALEVFAKRLKKALDLVNVVRCKDCKHSDFSCVSKDRCYCTKNGAYFNFDGYCSYGVRDDADE